MKKVTVIGSGSWGTALAVMLAQNGHEVMIWSRRQDAVDELLIDRKNERYLPGIEIPENIQATTDREAAVKGAEIIILAVPSRAVAETVRDFEGAVIRAKELAKEGDTVILSPACTSFDAFDNFEERGNFFKEIVNSF